MPKCLAFFGSTTWEGQHVVSSHCRFLTCFYPMQLEDLLFIWSAQWHFFRPSTLGIHVDSRGTHRTQAVKPLKCTTAGRHGGDMFWYTSEWPKQTFCIKWIPRPRNVYVDIFWGGVHAPRAQGSGSKNPMKPAHLRCRLRRTLRRALAALALHFAETSCKTGDLRWMGHGVSFKGFTFETK